MRARAPRQSGYTLIEVLAAVAVMGTGLLGIIALQGASVTANQRANEVTTAVNLARRWQERLRRDALQWTAPAAGNPVTNIQNTWYLRGLLSANSTGWAVPAQPTGLTAPLESAAFDFLGNDVAVNSPAAYYCTHVRLTRLVDNDLVRSEVRVWWFRRGGVRPSTYGSCGAGAMTTIGNDTTNVHWVHLSQTLARHEL